MTPAELWAHAQTLPSSTEAERRAKISRSYYALYSHACDFNDSLDSKGILFKKDSGTHNRLSQALTNPTVKDDELQKHSRSLGTMQKLAHELRIKADYNLLADVTQADVQKCSRYVGAAMAIPVQVKKAA